ncbi:MAG: AAA family ATPase, partial [Candidatus Rokubacteria bacterium]|nr:AAA family ATPase [Candidatus Rokubacteria bacterium]
DAPDVSARASLRQTLSLVGKALGATAVSALSAGPRTVRFDPAGVEIDVMEFEDAVVANTPPALERAARVYRGDLLAGLVISDPLFKEWLLEARERLRELAVEVQARLLAHRSREGDDERAIQAALRLLALDPLQEAAHRTLMRLYARSGRRAAALRQYQACVSVLQREFGTEPEVETRALYQDILRQPQATGREATPSGAAPVTSPGEPRADIAPPEIPIVGRVAELATLRTALDEARWGRGRVVAILGDAGIGKTTLLRALAAEASAQGAHVLLGHAHESEQILPFGPWVDALRSGHVATDEALLGGLAPVWRSELARLLPEVAVPAPPPADDSRRLFEAVSQLVTQLAAAQPLVLMLEDIHWVDAMTLRLIAFLGRRLGSSRVLLVVTARHEELDRAPLLGQIVDELDREAVVTSLTVRPLSVTETASLVRALSRPWSDTEALAHLDQRVWQVSEGNPFVIVEMVRPLAGAMPASSAGLALPDSVRASTASRLERLSDRGRELATVAAVIGREFEFPVLQRASGLTEPETAEGLEELVRRRVLREVGEAFDFVHDRVREVAYTSLLAPGRKLLHAAVGRALEALHASRLAEVSDRLAHHWARADQPGPAITYLRLFAARAARAYALDEALGALRVALETAGRLGPAERNRMDVEIALEQPLLLHLLGRIQAIRDLLEPRRAIVERLGDPALLGPYHFWLGHAASLLGDRRAALEHTRLAIAAGETCGDAATVGRAYHVLALEDFWDGRYRDGTDHGRRAVTLLEASAERWWLGHSHWTVGINLCLSGRFDASLEAFARVAAVARSVDDAHLATDAAWGEGWVRAFRGEWDEAIAACRRGLDRARDPMDAAVARGFLGFAHLERGDAAEAIAELERAVGELEGFGYSPVAAGVTAFLAEACRIGGQPARGREAARRASEVAAAVGFAYGRAFAERVLGRMLLAEGAIDAAADRLHAVLAALAATDARFEVGRAHLDLAEVAHARGDRTAAAEHLLEAGRILRELGVPWWAARARRRAHALGLTAHAARRSAATAGRAGSRRPP